ncbi:unnamed protein product [Cercopithifilaria johnstoni]|uniref:Uncharacterized protein n=1 Tax=Cercopithifilaria johnstoni TaxID=2874296 RepID=A0A8J2PTX0_9BILA|nr:unnamed protein product [Cercopithifilaria johnstoni]
MPNEQGLHEGFQYSDAGPGAGGLISSFEIRHLWMTSCPHINVSWDGLVAIVANAIKTFVLSMPLDQTTSIADLWGAFAVNVNLSASGGIGRSTRQSSFLWIPLVGARSVGYIRGGG